MSNSSNINLLYDNELLKNRMKMSEWSLSFCGCGFLGSYHIGVLACIRETCPTLINHVSRIYGSSVGTLIGVMIICGIESQNAFNFMYHIVTDICNYKFGIFNVNYDVCEVIRGYLVEQLPSNIHELASNRLYINMTCFPSFKSMLVSQFYSKDDFIDAVVCSCYVPCITSKCVQRFRGKICMDGGLSDNQPTPNRRSLCESIRLINVSPFIGEGDIAPKSHHDYCDNSVIISNQKFIITFYNIKRLIDGFNPRDTSALKSFALEGYKDAEIYFKHRKKNIEKFLTSNELNTKLKHYFPTIKESTDSFKAYLTNVVEEQSIRENNNSIVKHVFYWPIYPMKWVFNFYINILMACVSSTISICSIGCQLFFKVYQIVNVNNWFYLRYHKE